MIYNEPPIWELGSGKSIGLSINNSEIDDYPVNNELFRKEISLPGFSEPEIVRHFTRLSTWNYGVDTGIYPLGSCTMKYNPKINEREANLKGLRDIHPLIGNNFSQGALEILFKTEELLKEITGMDFVTLQPAAGAHGELTSMLLFNKYYKSKCENRDTILIPDSAHGTNPASASLCGYKTRVIKSNNMGIIDPKSVAEVMDYSVAGLMITNPNTLGLFETEIKEICDIVHKKGGLVYLDGANLNALMGVVNIGKTGVDAMHINLHKTFSTPHGGGGPGSGPVCVNKKLSKFLPSPKVFKNGEYYSLKQADESSVGRVHSFYGHFSVVVKALSYILTMGSEGLRRVSELAVLNANYLRCKLEEYFHIPYDSPTMHEVLFTDKFQSVNGVTTMDIAKAIIDSGCHPPTIYFPLIVKGAMLTEPTESESLYSLDNFINSMIVISKKIDEDPNVVKNSPYNVKRYRVDETLAARNPILKGKIYG